MKSRRPRDFDYQRYLASREWSLLREEVRERSGNRCEHCFVAPQQAVHHLTYERIGHEDLDDLMAVCNPCHEFLSGKSKDNPMRDYYVISQPLLRSRHNYEVYVHFAVPYDQPEGTPRPWPVRLVWCEGEGCIWCGYVDAIWALFLSGAVMP